MTTTTALGVSDDVKRLMKDAEKLGQWCAPLTMHEIANVLKVRL